MWVVDVSAWDGDSEQVNTWFSCRASNDYRALIDTLVTVVSACPYTDAPARVGAYEDMTVKEFYDVCEHVDRAASALFEKRRNRMKDSYVLAQSFPYALKRDKPPEDRLTIDHLIDKRMIHRANLLEMCREFGWTLDYVEGLDPFLLSEILGYLDGRNEHTSARAG
jgi:hypothetical protein